MTWRAVTIGIIITVLVNLWIRDAELVTGRYVSIGNPPPPAVAALLLLVVLGAVLRPLLKRWRFSDTLQIRRAEALSIYAFLCISIPVGTYGVVRAFFPCLTVPFYFATPENHFDQYTRYIPRWFVPHDTEVIRACYEGADNGAVPWHAWLGPLALWTCFFLVFFLTMLCIITLFRRQWVEHDRLSFPLLYLPVEMTQFMDGRHGGGFRAAAVDFFRDPLMWLGFSVAAVYNITNMMHAVNPLVPALGVRFDLGPLFTERPLNALQPLSFTYLLELIGFGYLVPMDMLFSLWFFYLLSKVMAVCGRMIGFEPPGFPYQYEQSAGAYLGLVVLLVWLAREPLRRFVTSLWRPSETTNAEEEGVPPRLAFAGTVIGFALLLAWCKAAGMSLIFAGVFFATVLGYAVVCSRIRGEAGLPITWPFPYDLQKEMWINMFGTERLAVIGGWQSMTLLSTFSWLSRHFYPTLMAYQLDNLRLSDEAAVSRRRMAAGMVIALLVGLICAFWTHLSAYYAFGENILEGNPLVGDYRTRVAVAEYTRMIGAATVPRPPDLMRTGFAGFGFAAAIGLAALRYAVPRCPLHPLGYAVSLAYGTYTPYWGPCLLVWLLKLIILKLGGAPLYKRLIPAFLGLALGHYFMGGMVWPTIATFLPPQVSAQYHIAFGG